MNVEMAYGTLRALTPELSAGDKNVHTCLQYWDFSERKKMEQTVYSDVCVITNLNWQE